MTIKDVREFIDSLNYGREQFKTANLPCYLIAGIAKNAQDNQMITETIDKALTNTDDKITDVSGAFPNEVSITVKKTPIDPTAKEETTRELAKHKGTNSKVQDNSVKKESGVTDMPDDSLLPMDSGIGQEQGQDQPSLGGIFG